MTTSEDAINHLCVGPKGCGTYIEAKPFRMADMVTQIYEYGEPPPEPDTSGRRCAGPKCMAWRWAYVNRRVLYPNGDGIEPIPESEWQGYCGFVPGNHGIPEPWRSAIPVTYEGRG